MADPPKPQFDPQAGKLRQIQTIPALVKSLDEELGWPAPSRGASTWLDLPYYSLSRWERAGVRAPRIHPPAP